MNKKINPCGNSMRELSTEELVNIYGADTATPILCPLVSVVVTIIPGFPSNGNKCNQYDNLSIIFFMT